MTKIAIIGAGFSGLTFAHQLKDCADVMLFEKSRGVSGRTSTRYADPFQFDHGAQYFTARNEAFQNFLSPWIASGHVAPWEPKVVTLEAGEKPYKRDWFEPHYVATPRMNSLCKAMAEELDVRLATQITDITKIENKWQLHTEHSAIEEHFDWVISSAPAPQASALLPDSFAHHGDIDAAKMTACYSLMIGCEAPFPFAWEAAVVKASPIAWMAVNSSKPNRNTAPSLLIQTSNIWAEEWIDADRSEVEALLLAELETLTGITQAQISHCALHGWRYANTPEIAPNDAPFLIDKAQRLAACGDWCVDGRVEGAFLSGDALGKMLRNMIS